MEMRHIILPGIALVLSLSMEVKSQESGEFHKKNIIRTSLTISPSLVSPRTSLSSGGTQKISLHTDLEYYVQERFSLRGDVYYYAGEFDRLKRYRFYHSAFAGINFHPVDGRSLDPFIGIQPGVSFIEAEREWVFCDNWPCPNPEEVSAVNPQLSVIAGLNYFAPKFFHLFLNARYAWGNHLPSTGRHLKLHEVYFSGGLGIFFRATRH